jgi:hypothetical protein
MKKRTIWTVEEEAYLSNIWLGYSLSELSELLSRSQRAISQKSKELNLKPKRVVGSKAKDYEKNK